MNRIRIASLQYYIRPVKSFDEFALQVESLVETAHDYKVRILVFPEYFTVQLLTLGAVKKNIADQIKDLSAQEERIVNFMSELAKKYKIIIVAGSTPALNDDKTKLLNKCYVFGSDGSHSSQSKLHMTRFEKEEWFVSPGSRLKLFETDFGKFAVNICYDSFRPQVCALWRTNFFHVISYFQRCGDTHGFLKQICL